MIELSVQKVMDHHIQTIKPDAPVVEAASELYDHDTGSLVITTQGSDLPVGVVTKSDINMVVAEGKNPSEVSVEKIMSTPIISITTTDTIQTAAELMRDHSIKKLPVIDEEEECVGMLTASDLTYYLPTFVKKIHSHRPNHTNQ
jgi:CBS domain-containing protein